ncbi:MAG TPA: glycosyltransferase 61 family protein [Stellaceae bacterium]|nr:glycosyltransferase 61 family protein [Stellaceae bacterium]
MFGRPRSFRDIVVHPTQELPRPSADAYRGGPDWPHFARQVLVRHCWGAIPRPVDRRPHPAAPEWPYFDPERYLNPRHRDTLRWRPADTDVDGADSGLWCGPITEHFGHMIADFAMRLVLSAGLDRETPLVFGLPPLPEARPPGFFWHMLDHFGIDRERIMLVRRPTRFARLSVVPQAERPYGGFADRAYLRLLDRLAAAAAPVEREAPWVFVSRARLRRGRFVGEAALDRAMAAAGVRVFHPETVALPEQLRLYRAARRLIFSEGSALQALQLLGHVDADIVILPRRPGRLGRNIAALRPLRARAKSLRPLPVMRGIVCGLYDSGRPQTPRGMTILDEARLIAGLARLGIDLAPHWDPRAYADERDADLAQWVEERLAAPAHPGERAFIKARLAALSLRV